MYTHPAIVPYSYKATLIPSLFVSGNKRVIIKYEEDTIDTLGYPDGMCIDTEDKIWVANYGAGKVIRWDPQSGKYLLYWVF